MTSTEAMIYQLKKLKGKPLKQKVEHILTYFWLPIVLVLAFSIVIGSYIVHLVTAKDMALAVVCLNSYNENEAAEAFEEAFAEKAKIDLDEYEVQISTNLILDGASAYVDLQTVQALDAYISSNSVDLLACDVDIAIGYFYQEIFCDLNTLLTEQQMKQYEGSFLYADMALLRRMLNEEAESIQFPDPTKPEEMEEPVPVALLVNADSDFAGIYYPINRDSVAIGIIVNSENLDNATAFLDYIMQ